MEKVDNTVYHGCVLPKLMIPDVLRNNSPFGG